MIQISARYIISMATRDLKERAFQDSAVLKTFFQVLEIFLRISSALGPEGVQGAMQKEGRIFVTI